ncbi:hypothetical protein G6Z34_13690 [Clostridium perfringens]|uniref:Uncharacterized protein n=1 Tax=Clostridium perfringens TaxID=1502 RepID=A0AAP6WP59_CLOPF|nr:hypothetical protein [Clostridium perfringens]NGU31139.1 hypothetical protein [Clostridium perfringens]
MVKLKNDVREGLWQETTNIESRVRELKGVFANPISITQEVVNQFITEKDEIIQQLVDLQDKFEIEIKSEEYYQNLMKGLSK